MRSKQVCLKPNGKCRVTDMALGSSRPYLVRALYEWIVDGDEDPYVVVDCFYPGVEVPESHVKDGQIVLNLAPRAITGLQMDAHAVAFQTRFGGVPTDLYVPYGAVTAIYGRDSGLGMAFGQEPGGPPALPGEEALPTPVFEPPEEASVEHDEPAEDEARPQKGRPVLRIVKTDDD